MRSLRYFSEIRKAPANDLHEQRLTLWGKAASKGARKGVSKQRVSGARNCSFSERKSAGLRQGNGNCDVKMPYGYGMGPPPPSAWQRGAVPDDDDDAQCGGTKGGPPLASSAAKARGNQKLLLLLRVSATCPCSEWVGAGPGTSWDASAHPKQNSGGGTSHLLVQLHPRDTSRQHPAHRAPVLGAPQPCRT